MNKVFVYGTLKRGHSNNPMLDRQTYLGNGTTKRKFVMYRAGIPFVVDEELSWLGDEPTHIHGELWMVDKAGLVALDQLEGHPYAYRRSIVDIMMSDGSEETAEMYLYTRPPAGEYVRDGIYRVAQPRHGSAAEETTTS